MVSLFVLKFFIQDIFVFWFCYGRELNGVLGERFIFRVGMFADRGMLPGLARTTDRCSLPIRVSNTREYK